MTISVAHQFSDIRGALGAHWGLKGDQERAPQHRNQQY